jgi:hypothetical protein
LSPIVGPGGRIIAEDVVPEYLQGLRDRVRDLGLQNVVISRGEPHDPRLPADSLDMAWQFWCTCNMRNWVLVSDGSLYSSTYVRF